jgi:hypothetical protein
MEQVRSWAGVHVHAVKVIALPRLAFHMRGARGSRRDRMTLGSLT